MEWNVLVVDDKEDLAEATSKVVSSHRTLTGHTLRCDVVIDFDEAKSQVLKSKYDLVILDLRDDLANDDLKGKEVLESLRASHFLPVIFYSGYAEKVRALETPLVKVVVKGENDIESLRTAVREIFSTGLPQLIRHIHEQQRSYLWSHVDNFWKETAPVCEPAELAYLLARRLGNALRGSSIREFLKETRGSSDVVHPIEMYVWPPMGEAVQAGDVLKLNGRIYVVLNPACDFAQNKIEFLMLAECLPLSQFKEYAELAADKLAGAQRDAGKFGALKSLVSDNRGGKKVQPDRYKYLPKTVFLEGGVIDFQRLTTIARDDGALVGVERVATLDTPFVESILSKFSRYYGRIGTPNLEAVEISEKIFESIPAANS